MTEIRDGVRGLPRRALALLLIAVALTGSGLAAQGADAHHKPFVRPLPIPKVLTGRRIRIPIRAAGVGILPGPGRR